GDRDDRAGVEEPLARRGAGRRGRGVRDGGFRGRRGGAESRAAGGGRRAARGGRAARRGEGAGGVGAAAGRAGHRRRPDPRPRWRALRQAGRPRRGAPASDRDAGTRPRAARRHRRGRARRGGLARHRDLAALDARLLRRLPRSLPGARRAGAAGVGGLLPAGGRGRAAVRAHRGRLFRHPRPAAAAAARVPARTGRYRRMKPPISGATVEAGVAGAPVAHSLSPLIHNAWLEAAGIDGVYVAFSPPADGFTAFARGLGGGAIRGLNVTVPFKEDALRLADAVSAAARRAGAANLLVFEADGRIRADNTDGAGLLAAIAEQAPGFDVRRGPVVILGAGGAARGAAAALVDA